MSFAHVWPKKIVRHLALSIALLHLFSVGGWGQDVPAVQVPPGSQTEPPPQGAFVGQAMPVSYVAAAELKKVLQPLGAPGGAVLDQPGGKSLMIVDTPENIRRLIAIKDAIDIPGFEAARFDSYEVKGAAAEELSVAANEFLRNQLIRTDPSVILAVTALPSGNRILLVSNSEAGLNDARRMLERLDRRAPSRRRLYIYPLAKDEVAAAEKAVAAWTAAQKANTAPAHQRPQAKIDSITNTLIVFGTPEEFQAVKDPINPATRTGEFKQRMAAIAQLFGSEVKPQKPALKS